MMGEAIQRWSHTDIYIYIHTRILLNSNPIQTLSNGAIITCGGEDLPRHDFDHQRMEWDVGAWAKQRLATEGGTVATKLGFSVGDNLGATVIVGDESKPMLVYLRGRTSICSYLRVHQGSMVLTHICQEISHNISPTYCCFGVTPRVVRGARNSWCSRNVVAISVRTLYPLVMTNIAMV